MSELPPAARVSVARVAFIAVAVLSLGSGMIAAESAAWTCDDAFLSIRSARNLVEGNGLVFNAGERVEAFTNLAWTLILALGLALRLDPETFGEQLGVACFAASLGVLVWHAARRPAIATSAAEMGGSTTPAAMRTHAAAVRGAVIPIAALIGATHQEWVVFATSGLETSMLCLLVSAGFVALERDLERVSPRGVGLGLVMGLAAATRPDAAIFGAAVGLGYLIDGRRGPIVRYGLTFAACISALALFRWTYYGDIVPNTYWAKSADRPWWGQGARYLQLYLEQYGALLLGPLMIGVAAIRARDAGRSRAWWATSLAMTVAVVLYGAAVVRAGGDFMFGRLFVPLTPLLALLVERGIVAIAPGRALPQGLVCVLIVGSMQWLPRPVSAKTWRYGVADEWEFYSPRTREHAKRAARALAQGIEDVDVRIVFLGTFARIVDEARVPYAHDAETGLTDPGLARRPLEKRGRPGHEKRATVPDLLALEMDLALGAEVARILDAGAYIPVVYIHFGDLPAILLRWRPEVIDGLRANGIEILDFPAELDDLIAHLDQIDDESVKLLYDQIHVFYFAHVSDEPREAAFRHRLAEGAMPPRSEVAPPSPPAG